MDDDERFEFDTDTASSSPLPAILLAAAAIVGILLVNSTPIIPDASAHASGVPSAKAPDVVIMPALMQTIEDESDCASAHPGRHWESSKFPGRLI